MRSIAVLAAASIVAGCLGLSPDVPPSGSTALSFGAPVRMPGEQVGAEPNIVAADGGKVWVVAPGSVIRDPNLARSEVSIWATEDRGETWEARRSPPPRDPESLWCSCDADIDVGPDGALFLTDFWVTPALNGFVVETSMDGGRTWGRANFITVTRPAANDRQYILAGPEAGEVYLTYARGGLPAPDTGALPTPPLSAPDNGLHVLRSDDHGATFSRLAMAYQETPETGAFIGKMRLGPDGTLYYPWVEFPQDDPWNGSATVVVATSTDRGESWTRHEVADIRGGTGGLWPMQADVGPDGVLHVLWMERVAGRGSVLWYATSTDQAATFAAPRPVGWTNGTALLPWIAHAGSGRAVVAFYGAPDAVEPLEAAEDQRWDAWALLVDSRERGAGNREPVRVSPWPVKVGRFCPHGASCPEDRELLDYPGVVWREGSAYVAFAASILDEGAGPPDAEKGSGSSRPTGGHATAAHVYVARAPLP
ncbi:MAG: hypothetical protein ACT4PT_02075 [Methanobacteriota archaeon]